jgi:hypothetical protein
MLGSATNKRLGRKLATSRFKLQCWTSNTTYQKVFTPVDPLHLGDATPIAQFTDEFTAQRAHPFVAAETLS